MTAKEHPIIFSTPMVQAILDGRKTQTRRIIKKPSVLDMISKGFINNAIMLGNMRVGDVLWVRETWKWEGDTKYTDLMPLGNFYYKADFENGEGPCKWKPSIFMPKTASRIFLRVTDIRVERLQDISEEDCIKEGISQIDNQPILYDNYLHGKNVIWQMDGEQWDIKRTYGFTNPIHSYHSLWESINGIGSWNLNPYVWVYEFEVI